MTVFERLLSASGFLHPNIVPSPPPPPPSARKKVKGDLENEVDFSPPISIKRSHQAFLEFYVLCNIITKAYEHKKQGCGSDFSRGGGSNRVTNSSPAPSFGANGKRTWIRG